MLWRSQTQAGKRICANASATGICICIAMLMVGGVLISCEMFWAYNTSADKSVLIDLIVISVHKITRTFQRTRHALLYFATGSATRRGWSANIEHEQMFAPHLNDDSFKSSGCCWTNMFFLRIVSRHNNRLKNQHYFVEHFGVCLVVVVRPLNQTSISHNIGNSRM